ncbi:hypothetical protein N5T82_10540 [Aliarcobacter cryaerophilus]|uniref:Uncharacterized protein n=1 Tax=Aliarcobacter cryaerophilus TaxID=28198 RepID=A0AA46NMF7_9BACT|nr:hypothetical protein [Aliarcobacter cryaerophilus]MCT7540280.1 hypothetical protein [Aliarcobacter cryaerophilus]UYF43034.1 hypothetical protein NGX11_09060 [Aliarcobacter cryaerophilus]
MNTRDILIIIASIAVIIFISDSLNTKYNMSDKTVVCISPEVEESLLNLITPDVNNVLKTEGFYIDTKVLRENTSTELVIPTVNGQSKYSCNTSIAITLKALPDNNKSQEIISKFIQKQTNFTIDLDYTVTPNDLGTQFWVKSRKIVQSDITNNFKKYEEEQKKIIKQKELSEEVSKYGNLTAMLGNKTINVKFNLVGNNKTIIVDGTILNVEIDDATTDEKYDLNKLKGHLISDKSKTWEISYYNNKNSNFIFYNDPISAYSYVLSK